MDWREMIACWRIGWSDSVDDDCCGCDGVVVCEGVAGVGVAVVVVVGGGCEGALKSGREDGCYTGWGRRSGW